MLKINDRVFVSESQRRDVVLGIWTGKAGKIVDVYTGEQGEPYYQVHIEGGPTLWLGEAQVQPDTSQGPMRPTAMTFTYDFNDFMPNIWRDVQDLDEDQYQQWWTLVQKYLNDDLPEGFDEQSQWSGGAQQAIHQTVYLTDDDISLVEYCRLYEQHLSEVLTKSLKEAQEFVPWWQQEEAE